MVAFVFRVRMEQKELLTSLTKRLPHLDILIRSVVIIAHLNFFGALCEFIIFLSPQTQRRLAQNREAAKKSRLRKKVWYFYVPLQQLMKYLCFCFVKTEFWSLVLSGLCSAARDKPVEANSLRARTWSC